jgi:6-pyruvoyltetrahydropterin/6-carboxytetrahydropterin synthase
MKAELIKTFRFDAAHALPNVPAGHKCGSMHGHSYRVDVHVEGPVDPHAGWVMDFARISSIVRPLIDQLDHHDLGQIPGLANSTSELLAQWLWQRIKPELPELSAVAVCESETAKCVYRGQ